MPHSVLGERGGGGEKKNSLIGKAKIRVTGGKFGASSFGGGDVGKR